MPRWAGRLQFWVLFWARAGDIYGWLEFAQVAALDGLIPDPSGVFAVGYFAHVGLSTRQGTSPQAAAAFPARRIRSSQPDPGLLGDLESASVAVHASHGRAGLGRHWSKRNHGGHRM